MSYFRGRRIYIDSDGNEHFDYERDYEPKPITNADRIRAMTDEELAHFLETINSCYCSFAMGKSPCDGNDCPCWLDWLK